MAAQRTNTTGYAPSTAMVAIVAVVVVTVANSTSCASRPREPDGRHDTTIPGGGHARAGGGAVDAADTMDSPVVDVDAPRVGELEVIVRWPRVPSAWRLPGPLPVARRCGEPAMPPVRIDAAFGVGDVVVFVETAVSVETAATAPAAPSTATTQETRLVLGPCDPTPALRIAAAGDLLLYNQGDVRQVSLSVSAWALPPQKSKVQVRTQASAGELLLMSMKEPGVYRVNTSTTGGGESLLVVANTPFIGITDDHGSVRLSELPPGEHRVIAWLPARGAATEQLASGAVQIEAGKIVKIVLTLGTP